MTIKFCDFCKTIMNDEDFFYVNAWKKGDKNRLRNKSEVCKCCYEKMVKSIEQLKTEDTEIIYEKMVESIELSKDKESEIIIDIV